MVVFGYIVRIDFLYTIKIWEEGIMIKNEVKDLLGVLSIIVYFSAIYGGSAKVIFGSTMAGIITFCVTVIFLLVVIYMDFLFVSKKHLRGGEACVA